MQGLPIHAAIILNLPKSYDSLENNWGIVH